MLKKGSVLNESGSFRPIFGVGRFGQISVVVGIGVGEVGC